MTPDHPQDDRARDWFLRGSRWPDVRWEFAPTSLLEEERPVSIRWDFMLSEGRRFTDPPWAELLESARRVIALARVRSPSSGLPQRAVTAAIYFRHLRMLVCWMVSEGYARFDAIDPAALERLKLTIAARTSQGSKRRIAHATIAFYLRLLSYLFRFRTLIGDGLKWDPCPGSSAHASAGVTRAQRRSHPYTPDALAVALIQGGVEFLETSAFDLLAVREHYRVALVEADRRHLRGDARTQAGIEGLRACPVNTLHGERRLELPSQFDDLIDMLYVACFVVIAYLVGARVSEILQLRAGCLKFLTTESDLAIISGAIFKLEAGYHGRAHQWVAPTPAVHAIGVLEALSAHHRARSGRDELWLRTRDGFRNTSEWHPECDEPLWVPSTTRINALLARFAKWIALPEHDGKPWRLSTHQGRKTFARFVALRDRTGLFALAQHLGHRDRAITDAGYVGTDYELHREIEAQILEQSVSAWEHMLSVPTLGGRAGEDVLAKRPRFRGAAMKEDLKSYARMLVEAGLTLGVCDWGYCVYREDSSACRGDARGPNAIHREPSTCVRCRNFAVSSHHRAYWLTQRDRYQALLEDPSHPTQTLKIARERLTEALAVLRSIGKDLKT